MTLTLKRDLDSVKMNLRVKYLGQRSLSSRVIVWTLRHTHQADCSTWTTKMSSNYRFTL